jgi:hypothetical protein
MTGRDMQKQHWRRINMGNHGIIKLWNVLQTLLLSLLLLMEKGTGYISLKLQSIIHKVRILPHKEARVLVASGQVVITTIIMARMVGVRINGVAMIHPHPTQLMETYL